MALKFGSSKSEFGLRSGTANKGGLPFKQMGSSPTKGIFDIGLKVAAGLQNKPESLFAKYPSKTKESIADEEAQEVLAKTDKDIASTKTAEEKKSYEDRLASVKERDISLQEKKYADKTSTTKPSMTAEEIKKGKSKAKARDIFTAMGSGKAEFSHQQAFEDKMTGLDVATAEKTENQEELPPAEQFVDDGSYTAVSDAKSSTGSEMFGGIDDADYNTWSDEDLEKRRTDPTYRPS